MQSCGFSFDPSFIPKDFCFGVASPLSQAPVGQPDNVLNQQYENQIHPCIDLIDSLRALGMEKDLALPAIAVVGDQSSGKSSVLEALSGVCLPRGSGIATRCPLELQLKKSPKGSTWCGKISYQFHNIALTSPAQVENEVRKAQNCMAGTGNGVSDQLITLEVMSPNVPDLTLIDLPGITRVALPNQPLNIGQQIKEMIIKYISRQKTIILAVVPSNVDIATTEALELAKQVDPKGNRTLGILTKPDLVDKGAEKEVMRVVRNLAYPLKKGYMIVKCHRQSGLQSNLSLEDSINNERAFFEDHEHFSVLLHEGCATVRTVAEKLTVELVKHIHSTLPTMEKQIIRKLWDAEDKLNLIGSCVPDTDTERLAFLIERIRQFAEGIGKATRGEEEVTDAQLKLFTKIQKRFNLWELNLNSSADQFPKEIRKGIDVWENQYRGREMVGIVSFRTFENIARKQIQKFEDPAIVKLNEVTELIRSSFSNIASKHFLQFPNLYRSAKAKIENICNMQQKEAEKGIRTQFTLEKIIYCQDILYGGSLKEAREEATKPCLVVNQDKVSNQFSLSVQVQPVAQPRQFSFDQPAKVQPEAQPGQFSVLLPAKAQPEAQPRLFSFGQPAKAQPVAQPRLFSFGQPAKAQPEAQPGQFSFLQPAKAQPKLQLGQFSFLQPAKVQIEAQPGQFSILQPAKAQPEAQPSQFSFLQPAKVQPEARPGQFSFLQPAKVQPEVQPVQFSFLQPAKAEPEAQPGQFSFLQPAKAEPEAQPSQFSFLQPAKVQPEAQPSQFSFLQPAKVQPEAQPGQFSLLQPAKLQPEAQPGQFSVLLPAKAQPEAQPGQFSFLQLAKAQPKLQLSQFSFLQPAKVQTEAQPSQFSFLQPAKVQPVAQPRQFSFGQPAKVQPAAQPSQFSFLQPAKVQIEAQPGQFSILQPAKAQPEAQPSQFSFLQPAKVQIEAQPGQFSILQPAKAQPEAQPSQFSFLQPAKVQPEARPGQFSFLQPAKVQPEVQPVQFSFLQPAKAEPEAQPGQFSFLQPAKAEPEAQPSQFSFLQPAKVQPEAQPSQFSFLQPAKAQPKPRYGKFSFLQPAKAQPKPRYGKFSFPQLAKVQSVAQTQVQPVAQPNQLELSIVEMSFHIQAYFKNATTRLANQIPLIIQYYVLFEFATQLESQMMELIQDKENLDVLLQEKQDTSRERKTLKDHIERLRAAQQRLAGFPN
ncbi:uncharacterized protein [Aquarana catesbeiana]